MRILITGARAPVALEWARLALAGGHQVWMADSLHWPLGRFVRGIQAYIRWPSPRQSLNAYSEAVTHTIEQQKIDWIIPTCEEIFYLAQVRDRGTLNAHWLIPKTELLFQLHHKFDSLALLDGLGEVRTPVTTLCQQPSDIRADADSILKPVYSRFGRQLIRQPQHHQLNDQLINAQQPWVQQQCLIGAAWCNYALFINGKLIAHQAYRPRYRFNQAAASYFEPIEDSRLATFAQQFGQRTGFHGQAAFDFIEQDGQLFCIECNPRATSGLHLLRHQLALSSNGQWAWQPSPVSPVRVGISLPIFYGLRALTTGRVGALLNDYRRASDALHDERAPLQRGASLLALTEMLARSLRWRRALTDASTFDIEWNGPEVSSC